MIMDVILWKKMKTSIKKITIRKNKFCVLFYFLSFFSRFDSNDIERLRTDNNSLYLLMYVCPDVSNNNIEIAGKEIEN